MLLLQSNKTRWIVVLIFILVIWTAYRYLFLYPEWVDEFIAKPILQVLPVFLTVLCLEKKPLGSIGLTTVQLFKKIGVGLLIGAVLFAETYVMQKMKIGFHIAHIDMSLLLPFFVSLATGFTEELVYRGYFTNRLLDVIENVYVANAVQTIIFVSIHIPLMIFVFHYSPTAMLLYSIQLAILGYVYGIVFITQESIIPSAIAHAMWNFSNVLFR